MKLERRYLPASEIRVQQDSNGRTISGYAILYNSLSADMGFREMVAPGAFTRSLKENPDVRCLFNHNTGQVLGRTTSGTLELTNDDRGLSFRCTLPDTSYANDLAVSIGRGDISQCSFGFSVDDQEWSMEDGYNLRTVTDATLYEISPVTFPAYDQTSVAVRSLMFPDGEVKPPEIEAPQPEAPQQEPDNEATQRQLQLMKNKLDLVYYGNY